MKSSSMRTIVWFGLPMLLVIALGGCRGDRGGGTEEAMQSSPTAVTIAGQVDDGTPRSPIADASCSFVESNGTVLAQASTDHTGVFSLQITPEKQGFIYCNPPDLVHLVLSTFVSTMGKKAGDTLPERGLEEVSPRSTVISLLLAQEHPSNPQGRKAELVAALAAGDPALSALVDAAVEFFQPLYAAELDVTFTPTADLSGEDTESSDGGGSGTDAGNSSIDGGVAGAVGDGAEFSPIPNAVCIFSQTLEGKPFFNTVLYDLFVNGQVTRPDLQAVAAQVNQALAKRATAIAEACATLFPAGIGQPLQTIAAGANTPQPGSYFLPIPPGVPGFVLCHPPDQEQLVQATFVRARQEGELLTGQDVTPAATMFSTHIALLAEDLTRTQENYLADIAALRVGVRQVNGDVIGFEMIEPLKLRDVGVGWVAYAATALYTTLFKKVLNADYPTALRGFLVQDVVESSGLAENPGVSQEQAEEVANIVNVSINTTAEQLGADTQAILSSARIDVRVQEQQGGGRLQGATVDLLDTGTMIRCLNCPAVTNEEGAVTLTMLGAPREQPIAVTLRASLEGFEDDIVTRRLLAVARIRVDFKLSSGR